MPRHAAEEPVVPYTAEEVDNVRKYVSTARLAADGCGDHYDCHECCAFQATVDARWLATVDALRAERDEAVALLADARKCVSLVNTNGYYNGWIARCDAIVARRKA